MKLALRILVPVVVVALAFLTFTWMTKNPPEARRSNPPPTVTSVEATRLKPVDYQVRIPSHGIVTPRTRSTLKPEVSGRVISIAANFRDGGFFEEGDVLLKIDPRDYETAVVVAQATLAQREGALEIERAQHEQAVENWNLLGDGTDPSPLTLREPQLAEANANVESAKARLVEAERNLKRTEIRAPYAGRILNKQVDVGQYVSPGNILAEVFAIDYIEVRLPIPNSDLDFIRLPEAYRDDDKSREKPGPKVVIKSSYGSRDITWEGEIVRVDSAFDAETRQLFVVAQIDDPYSRADGGNPPLKANQFVNAEILGDVLEDVFVIPRPAVRDGKEILIVDSENKIRRRPVDIIWRGDDHVVVRDNLSAGEILCTTSMQFAADGAIVAATIDGVEPKPKGSRGGGFAGGPRPGPGGPSAAPRSKPSN